MNTHPVRDVIVEHCARRQNHPQAHYAMYGFTKVCITAILRSLDWTGNAMVRLALRVVVAKVHGLITESSAMIP